MSNSKKKCDCGGEMTRMPHFSWCSINRVDSVSLSDDMDMKELDTALAGMKAHVTNSTRSIPHQLSGNGITAPTHSPVTISYGTSHQVQGITFRQVQYVSINGIGHVDNINYNHPTLGLTAFSTLYGETHYAFSSLNDLMQSVFFSLGGNLHDKYQKFYVRKPMPNEPENSEWILVVSWKP